MGALVRIINENDECACIHRDLSVCDDCFAATPGLVSSYDVVYVVLPGELDEILASKDVNVFVSPGTR